MTVFAAFMRRPRAVEWLVAAAMFVLVLTALTNYKLIRSDELRGDSAMYLQATENIVTRFAQVSQAQARLTNYLTYTKFLTTPADEIAKHPDALFGMKTPPDSERSLMLGHAYFIMYPLAQFARVFPVDAVLFFFFALSFGSMLLVAYLALRAWNVPIVAALLFPLLIVAHPVWWEGLLEGQFYPDRLFVGAGFLLMVLASRMREPATRTDRIWLVVVALACASTNERGALVAGLFLLAHTALYWKSPNFDRFFRAGLGGAVIVYGYIALKVVSWTDPQYGGFFPAGINDAVQMMQTPHFQHLVAVFLIVNAPFLLLALFEWRAAAIAFFLMLPNIFGNIGGAEKVGWSSHYPSFYFPSLIWAALMGYRALYARVRGRKSTLEFFLAPVAIVLFLSMINQNQTDSISISSENAATKSFAPTLIDHARDYVINPQVRDILKTSSDAIKAAVPPHALVSSIEAGMPLLYKDRTLEFFPAGIDNADYAVLSASKVDGKVTYSGTITFLGAAEQAKIDALVLDRMRRDHYDLDHPLLFPTFDSLAVVRRIH